MADNEKMGQSDGKMIREAMLEGIFYPAEPSELKNTLQLMLSRVTPLDSEPRFVLCPHGSFEFSGPVMAAAYAAVSGMRPRRITIIAACIHEKTTKIYLPESEFFRTPIGESAVDAEAVQTVLGTSMLFETNDLPHLREHAIEVQLPFIQYLFPEVPILPVLIGQSGEVPVRALRGALAMLDVDAIPGAGPELVVLSANLSAVVDRETSEKQANLALELMTAGNAAGIFEAYSRGFLNAEDTAILALFAQLNTDGGAKLLARSSSLSVHYDTAQVTEYAALAL